MIGNWRDNWRDNWKVSSVLNISMCSKEPSPENFILIKRRALLNIEALNHHEALLLFGILFSLMFATLQESGNGLEYSTVVNAKAC